MQILDLNLAERPFRNNILLWVAYGAAIVGLLTFSSLSVAGYVKHKKLLSELNSKVDSIDAQTRDLAERDAGARAAIKKHDLEALTLQADKANEVIEGKAFSWTRLFNLLAEIQPYNVRMTSIRPIFRVEGGGPRVHEAVAAMVDGRSVPVSIDAVAKTYADMLEMQSALIEDPHFGRLEMERLFRAQNNREYIFQLNFLYFPDTEIPQEAEQEDPDEPPAGDPEDEGASEPPAEGQVDGHAGPPTDADPPADAEQAEIPPDQQDQPGPAKEQS